MQASMDAVSGIVTITGRSGDHFWGFITAMVCKNI
jgi:hypothetical protein